MKRWITLSLLLLLGILGTGFFLYRANDINDPKYQGKRLSEWLLDFQKPSLEQQQQAREAVRQLGPKAVRPLCKLFLHEDSSITKRFKILCQKQSLVKVQFVPEEIQHACVIHALKTIGPAAEAAIPLISPLLERKGRELETVQALSVIGPKAMPTLARALTNTSPAVRWAAALAIMQTPQGGEIAIPNLIKNLHPEQEGYLVTSIIHTLSVLLRYQRSHDEPSPRALIISALARCLQDPRAEVRIDAASALGDCNEDAKSASSALVQLANDPDERVRAAASRALSRINLAKVKQAETP